MLALLLTGLAALTPTGERPRVLTTFYPTTYYTQRIAGDAVELRCVTPPDADPATWRPDRATLRELQTADLVVLNGAEFESWARRVSLSLASRVDTALAFKPEWLEYENELTHSHGTSGEHAHRGIDGHTWLDPLQARRQAEAIRDALTRALPERAADLQQGFDALAADLDQLDADFRALGEQPEGKVLLASHPAYNYVARRYGWRIVNLDLDPDEMPSDEQLAELRKTLEATPADYLLWESAPRAEIADRLKAELQLTSLEFSPCEAAATPSPGSDVAPDYLARMRSNLERLRPAFRGPG